MGSPATLPAMSQRATSMAPIARYVVWRFLCHIAWYRRSRSSGSWLSTTGFRYWIRDWPSRCAPRIEEPRKACPLTPSSVSMVTSPSWLLPLNFPVCRPYVVAGISSQPNSVRWTSVIFMVQGDYHTLARPDVARPARLGVCPSNSSVLARREFRFERRLRRRHLFGGRFRKGGGAPLRATYAPISTARMDSMRISSVRRALYAENSGVVLTV